MPAALPREFVTNMGGLPPLCHNFEARVESIISSQSLMLSELTSSSTLPFELKLKSQMVDPRGRTEMIANNNMASYRYFKLWIIII